MYPILPRPARLPALVAVASPPVAMLVPAAVVAAVVVAAVSAGGCTGRPSAIRPANISAAAAADEAMRLYDLDGDGALDAAELEQVPGILTALELYDSDGDGRVSRDELAARIRSWRETGSHLMSLTARVRHRGRPAAGAQVRFVPEPFLADALLPAEGTADASGYAVIAIEDDLLPADQRGLSAIRPGLYRVEVHWQDRTWNLGQEVAPDMRTDIVLLELP